MIGTFLVRSRRLIRAAVSKPSMPGICASRRISAKSSLQQRAQRLLAGAGPYQGLVEGAEDRLEGQEVLRAVVDQQDPGSVGHESHDRKTESSWSTSTGLVT